MKLLAKLKGWSAATTLAVLVALTSVVDIASKAAFDLLEKVDDASTWFWPLVANQRGTVNLEQWWIQKFHDTIHMVYQQMGSQLERLIAPEMVNRDVHAAIDYHERLGNVIANDVIVPYGPTKVLNPEASRRACPLVSSDATVLVADEYTLRMMVNPNNKFLQTIVAACGRRADKHLIDGLGGVAATAAVGAGALITHGSQALPSSRKIGTGVATALSLIINANELMSKASVPVGANQRVMLYGPGQERDILAITQASSSDFTKHKIHDTGTVNGIEWEGFLWVMVQDVIDPSLNVLQRMLPISGTDRFLYAFHRGAMGLSIGRPISNPQINNRPDLQSNPLQIRQPMMQGAVRVWEAGVVELKVLEN
jgi:hypothetical protein